MLLLLQPAMETINAHPLRRLWFELFGSDRRCGLDERTPNALIALQWGENSRMVFQNHENTKIQTNFPN